MSIRISGSIAAGTLAATLLAACGGSGGGGDAPAPAPAPAPASTVTRLSGTAATGLALADATVDAKCAVGSGTATTSATGTYVVEVENATLPCVLRATGTAGSTPVVLHSVVESGATASGGAITANVTPLTEMIVAQLAGRQPSELFESVSAGNPIAVATGDLAAATTAVVAALRTATGIDLGTVDPFKATLVAATTSAPTGGNDYDRLLDQIGAKVPVAALPLVVTQIANAAAAATTAPAGTTPPVTLAEVMGGVAGGAMPNCPQVLSGSYRIFDVFGRLTTRALDFAAGTVKDAAGATVSRITTDAARPCEMTLTSTPESLASDTSALVLKVAMGPQGAGAYHSQRTLVAGGTRESVGYVFPAQSHPYAAVQGAWQTMESGFDPGETNPWEHYYARLEIGAPGTAFTGCDYAPSLDASACTPWPATDSAMRLAPRTDGGFDLSADGQDVGVVYGYRAPNGSLVMFGSTNPSGANTPTTVQRSFVLKRPAPLAMPTVGSVSAYWDTIVQRAANTRNPLASTPPTPDSTTITAVDAAAGTATRSRTSDGRVDVLRINRFADGIRVREAGTGFAAAVQFPLAGLGITATANLNQSPSAVWFQSISVTRP